MILERITGFKQLGQELAGFYTVGSLQVLDCQGRLPLSRQWHEGCRVWDVEEVRRFRDEKAAKRAAKVLTVG